MGVIDACMDTKGWMVSTESIDSLLSAETENNKWSAQDGHHKVYLSGCTSSSSLLLVGKLLDTYTTLLSISADTLISEKNRNMYIRESVQKLKFWE